MILLKKWSTSQKTKKKNELFFWIDLPSVSLSTR